MTEQELGITVLIFSTLIMIVLILIRNLNGASSPEDKEGISAPKFFLALTSVICIGIGIAIRIERPDLLVGLVYFLEGFIGLGFIAFDMWKKRQTAKE